MTAILKQAKVLFKSGITTTPKTYSSKMSILNPQPDSPLPTCTPNYTNPIEEKT